VQSWARIALAATTTGAAGVAYAAGYERRRFTLREATLPVLAEGARPVRVLHISDLHMTPGQTDKQRWVADLARLEPDLVVDTGDNLAHQRAVPAVMSALAPLLERPGLFVFGSNDYFAPTPKNPARYLVKSKKRIHGDPLPWRDLRAAFIEHGWADATHTRATVDLGDVKVAAAGVDDPHLKRDRYDLIDGEPDATAVLRLGLTHSPEPHVLDAFAADGYDLVMAGHTHGGQLPLRPGPLRLPAGGEPADPRPPPDRRRRRFGNPRVGRRGRGLELARPSGGIGVWRSLVARFVRDEEVAGSNPVTPTTNSRSGPVPSQGSRP
jgi:predicted MPP superfamily phosphohydrolase